MSNGFSVFVCVVIEQNGGSRGGACLHRRGAVVVQLRGCIAEETKEIKRERDREREREREKEIYKQHVVIVIGISSVNTHAAAAIDRSKSSSIGGVASWSRR